MARIMKASESVAEFSLPDEGTYTATLMVVNPAKESTYKGKTQWQERFDWELADEEGEVLEDLFFDYVNIMSFFDGGGDPGRVSKLFKIVKAITGPDFDPEDPPSDTQELIGARIRIEIEHGVKENGSPKAVITSYKHIKKAGAKAGATKPRAPRFEDLEDEDEPNF